MSKIDISDCLIVYTCPKCGQAIVIDMTDDKWNDPKNWYSPDGSDNLEPIICTH